MEREVVETGLRLAVQAPNGSDRQSWGWVVVDDQPTKVRMAQIYRAALRDYVARPRTVDDPFRPDTPEQRRMAASVMYLTDHLADVPMLLVPTFDGRPEGQNVFCQASHWGSIAPGVWSFMLALRLHGLGSARTTLHLLREEEMAELARHPTDPDPAGIFPIVYTAGTDFRAADRSASEARIRWHHW